MHGDYYPKTLVNVNLSDCLVGVLCDVAGCCWPSRDMLSGKLTMYKTCNVVVRILGIFLVQMVVLIVQAFMVIHFEQSIISALLYCI